MKRERADLLQDYLELAAARAPEKVALVAGGRRVTFAELEAEANRLARALARRGVRRGDRVAVFGEPSAEAVASIWGVLKADATFMVLSRELKADKLRYILRDSGARAAIGSLAFADALAAAKADAPELELALLYGEGAIPPLPSGSGALSLEPYARALASESDTPPPRRNIDQDLASIIYTSGSTGEPKGVMLTHRNMLAAATSVSTYLGMVESDVVLCALPLAFDYGLYQVIMSTRVGARVVVEPGFAYPAAVLEAVARERVTGFPGVPTVFAVLTQMKKLDFDLSSVRFVTNTAAALPTSHIGRLREIFPRARVFSMYGLTECKRCTYLPPEDLERKPTSVGIAIPNTELWVEDEHRNRLGPGEVGELVIRGATVMRGYWNKPEATARRLAEGPLPGEMVLRTGDYCRLDEEGYVYFVGRMDEVFKSRGEKVAPKEVENVLYGLAGVREAAVVGVPDPLLGHAVKAFVALEAGSSLGPSEIVAHCKARLEPHMVPKIVEIRDALPKTDTGKIKKTGLA